MRNTKYHLYSTLSGSCDYLRYLEATGLPVERDDPVLQKELQCLNLVERPEYLLQLNRLSEETEEKLKSQEYRDKVAKMKQESEDMLHKVGG